MFNLRKIFSKGGKSRDFLAILEQFLGGLNFFSTFHNSIYISWKIYKFSLKPVRIMNRLPKWNACIQLPIWSAFLNKFFMYMLRLAI